MKLLIITGYSASGKSTMSFKFAKKHDYALLIQDNFLFKMNPSSLVSRWPKPYDHGISITNMQSCMKNYMETGKDIVIEGAMVSISDDDPLDIASFIDLAKKYKYEPIWISLVADEKTRRKRQKKRGNTLKRHIDKRLIKAADELHIKYSPHVIDTSKLTMKQCLESIEKIVGV